MRTPTAFALAVSVAVVFDGQSVGHRRTRLFAFENGREVDSIGYDLDFPNQRLDYTG